jgi:hypothetical protein
MWLRIEEVEMRAVVALEAGSHSAGWDVKRAD